MSNEPRKKKLIEHWKIIALGLMAFDYIAIHLAYFLALWFRFDCRFSEIPIGFLNGYLCSIIIYAFVSIVVFWLFGMYKCVWSFVSYPEVLRFSLGSALASLIYYIIFIRRPSSAIAPRFISLASRRRPKPPIFAFLPTI